MVVGISTDIIFTPTEMLSLAAMIPHASYCEIESSFGHDGTILHDASALSTTSTIRFIEESLNMSSGSSVSILAGISISRFLFWPRWLFGRTRTTQPYSKEFHMTELNIGLFGLGSSGRCRAIIALFPLTTGIPCSSALRTILHDASALSTTSTIRFIIRFAFQTCHNHSPCSRCVC